MNVWDAFLETAIVPNSGGQLSPIYIDVPDKGPYEFEDVSSDGSSLLVYGHQQTNGVGDIWVVGTQGHPARYLTRASHAAWSPDGKSVVYTGAFGDFHVIPSSGGESRLLINLSQMKPSALSTATPHFLENGRPHWSPDGRVIRFTWNQRIWEMLPNGANLHQLLPNWRPSSFTCCGRWTPDGELYVFRSGTTLSNSDKFDPGSQLFALDERRRRSASPRSDPIQLTSAPMLWGDPVPSHDGTRIFARGLNLRAELLRWDSEAKQLQPYLGGISAEFLWFSRDGRSVAYVSYPDGILWRANTDGTGQVQLTKPPMYPKTVRWSPDGTQIVFEDDSAGGVYSIYVVPAQGGTPVRVLPENSDSQTDPDWSPDGKSLVYAYAPLNGSRGAGERYLRVLDVATHKLTKVPGSEGCWSPRWSPDGRYIAALRNGIAVFDLEAHHWTTVQEGLRGYPTFSRDSRWIYFLRFIDAAVLRVPVSGGPAEQVIDLKDFRLGGFWGFWMGLDPTDAPLLLRDEGTEEIYALTLDRK